MEADWVNERLSNRLGPIESRSCANAYVLLKRSVTAVRGVSSYPRLKYAWFSLNELRGSRNTAPVVQRAGSLVATNESPTSSVSRRLTRWVALTAPAWFHAFSSVCDVKSSKSAA